jgi:hypothetical protein
MEIGRGSQVQDDLESSLQQVYDRASWTDQTRHDELMEHDQLRASPSSRRSRLSSRKEMTVDRRTKARHR